MHELALFAGAGGGLLGGRILGWEPACAVEWNPFCREVLLARQRDGMLPVFPIWDDVQTFRRDNPETGAYVEALGELAAEGRLVVTGGFPCQPFSSAGKQKGQDDERNMWPSTERILGEVGPRIALLENVPGLLRFDYFGDILGGLAGLGYDAEWGVVSARDAGAPHVRKRLWILAYDPAIRADPVGDGRVGGEASPGVREAHHAGPGHEVADSDGGSRAGEGRAEAGRPGRHIRGKGAEVLQGEGDGIPYPAGRGHGGGTMEGQGVDGEVDVFADAVLGGGLRDAGWWGIDPADVAGAVRRARAAEALSLSYPDDRKKAARGKRKQIVSSGMGSSDPDGGERAEVRVGERALSADVGESVLRGLWGAEPGLGRVADGVADRVDRLRAIGNGQVPVVAAIAFATLMGRAGIPLDGWVSPGAIEFLRGRVPA